MKTSYHGLLVCCLSLCSLSNAGVEGRMTPNVAGESRPADGNASGKAIANDDLEKDWETLYRLGEMRSVGCFRIGGRILNKHPEEIKARLFEYASGNEKLIGFRGFAFFLLMRTRMEDPDVRKLIIETLRRRGEFSPNPGIPIWDTAGECGSLDEGSTLRAMVKEDLFGNKTETAYFINALKRRIEKNTATREEIVDFLQWCHHATEGKKIQRWYAAELRRLGSEPDGGSRVPEETRGKTGQETPPRRAQSEAGANPEERGARVGWAVCATGAAALLALGLGWFLWKRGWRTAPPCSRRPDGR